jgi:hypothetical protein
VRTDSAQNSRKRQIFHNYLKGLFVLSLANHLYIALNIKSGGACQSAGGLICFFNGKGSWYGLRIKLKGGLFYGKTQVIFIAQFNRTNLGAFSTSGTFRYVYITSFLKNSGCKVAPITVQLKDFTVSKKLYVKVPADLDQFG